MNNSYIAGITDTEFRIIKNILSNFNNKYDFFAYGSRVKGTFSNLSDLDILIKGNNDTILHDIAELKHLFDGSDLPYIVNIADYNQIQNSFYNLIKDDLVKI